MDPIVLVGAGTVIVGVFVFVFGGAGLVGYFPSFFLSIIYKLWLIMCVISKIKTYFLHLQVWT